MKQDNETTIIAALRFASEGYAKIASMGSPANHRLNAQFARQSEEALRLASLIEQHGLDQAAYL